MACDFTSRPPRHKDWYGLWFHISPTPSYGLVWLVISHLAHSVIRTVMACDFTSRPLRHKDWYGLWFHISPTPSQGLLWLVISHLAHSVTRTGMACNFTSRPLRHKAGMAYGDFTSRPLRYKDSFIRIGVSWSILVFNLKLFHCPCVCLTFASIEFFFKSGI